jgi:hypothetical protein
MSHLDWNLRPDRRIPEADRTLAAAKSFHDAVVHRVTSDRDLTPVDVGDALRGLSKGLVDLAELFHAHLEATTDLDRTRDGRQPSSPVIYNIASYGWEGDDIRIQFIARATDDEPWHETNVMVTRGLARGIVETLMKMLAEHAGL